MRRAVGLACLAMILSACSESLEFADWTIPVPAGIEVYEYAAVPIEERTERIELIEDLVIGGDEADPSALLNPRANIRNALALDQEGRLFVLDRGNSRVAVFDVGSGSFLFDFGGEGQGPGEFQSAARIAIAGDQIVVMDTRAPKLSVWSLDGKHLRDVATRTARRARLFSGFSDGRLAIGFTEPVGEEQTSVLARIDADGRELNRYLTAPGPNTEIVMFPSGLEFSMSHTSPEAAFTVDNPERLYLVQADEYQVLALRPNGDHDWALRVAWSAEPYPRDYIDDMVRSIARGMPEVRASMFNWPERLPVLAGLDVDGHGHLYVFPYVQRSFVEKNGHQPVDVYSADGAHLFSGFIESRWQAANGDFAYVYERHDDTGAWSVVRYRLVEPFD